MSYSGITSLEHTPICAVGHRRKRSNPADNFALPWGNRQVKRSKPESIPKVAHTIWLNESDRIGTIPQERFLNIVALAKQFKTAGWHFKIWTNNPAIFHRANTCLSPATTHKGLSLESHFMPTASHDSLRGGSIEICSDTDLFPIMSKVDASYYREHNRENNLPDLWTPHDKSNPLFRNSAKKKSDDGWDSKSETEQYLQDIAELNLKDETSIDRNPFRRTLLNFYLAQQVGSHNFAAASDYLRVSALHKYGGLYIDSDTQPRSFKDQYKISFPEIIAKKEFKFCKGWNSGYGSDIIASIPRSKNLIYLLLDQFYQASRLEQLPYTVWKKGEDQSSLIRATVKYTSTGFSLISDKRAQLPSGIGNKDLVSIADATRYHGYFYSKINGAYPAQQLGADLKNESCQVSEKIQNLRFQTTIYSSGPQTLTRLIENCHQRDHRGMLFTNQSKQTFPYSEKTFDKETTLGITKWGLLGRKNSICWDTAKPLKTPFCNDDSKLQSLISAYSQESKQKST